MSFFKKLFGKKKKPTPTPEPVVTQKPVEEAPVVIQEPVIEPTPLESTPAPEVKEQEVVVEEPKEPIQEQPPVIEEEEIQEPIEPIQKPIEPAQEPPVVEEKNAPVPKSAKGRYSGKFEVFPEAGFYKYRLKASNGEILVVSAGYTTKNGAINGIETLKKNAEIGQYEIVTDKNKFSQFQLFNANGSRVIVTGEFYETVARAESALESFKKFVSTEKIEELQEIDPSEIREELVEVTQVEPKSNGKIEIIKEEKTVRAVLKASNGEVLFSTTPYASKASLLSGLESVKKAVESNNFRVSKDKQGRYQFVLYSANNQVLIAGETYKTKEAVLSVIDSVKRFLFQAKVIE